VEVDEFGNIDEESLSLCAVEDVFFNAWLDVVPVDSDETTEISLFG